MDYVNNFIDTYLGLLIAMSSINGLFLIFYNRNTIHWHGYTVSHGIIAYNPCGV